MSGLAALGAGLGGFADYWQRQQQQNRENAALALQLQAIQQQNQAAAAAWPAVLSGLAQQSQAVPQPQTQVPQTPVGTGMASFNPTSLLPPPSGGGATSSGARIPPTPTGFPVGSTSLPDRLSDSQVAQIGPLVNRDESGDRNVPNFRFDQGHTASGVAQITDSTWQDAAPKAGVDTQQYPTAMSAPIPVQNAVRDYLLKTRGVQPWAPYNPKLRADLAVGGASDAEPNPQQELLGTLRNMVGAAQSSIDPIAQGRASIKAVAQAIDQANPDAPPIVKMMALEQAQKLLAPSEQVQLAMMKQMYQDQFRIGLAELQGQLRANAPVTTAQQERLDIDRDRLDIERQRLAASGGGGGSLETSKTLEILDPKGNVVSTVLARERKNQPGWVDSQTGEPIKLDKGQQIREVTPTSAGGGRAGAQVLRQEIGAREVLSDLQNVVKMPVGSTTGIFGDARPGPSITDALKGDLTRTLTDQDSQLMQASLASMSRELSILMSPVYGGNWAAQQIDPLIPKQGDTVATAIFKLSRLAQSADNALEAIQQSPILSNDQKSYAADMRKQIIAAVPWTPAQAQAFALQHNTTESFGDFVKGRGISGGKPQPSAAAAPEVGKTPAITDQKAYDALAPGAHYIGPDGKPYIKGGQQ